MNGNELETLIDIGLAAWRRQSPSLCDVNNATARDAMRAAINAISPRLQAETLDGMINAKIANAFRIAGKHLGQAECEAIAAEVEAR